MKKGRLTLFFITISILWIFATNYLIQSFAPPTLAMWIEHSKEILYVIITGCFFYFYINKSEELSASQEEKRKLSTLINAMTDVVIFKDGEGRWKKANPSALALLQLGDHDYYGKKDSELAPATKLYRDAFKAYEISDEKTWKKRETTLTEETFPALDGTEIIFETVKVPLFHSDGSRKGLVIIGRDVTERHQVRNMLIESEQRYRSLCDYNPDIVYMIDLDGIITKLNPQFNVVTGYQAKETVGKHINEVVHQGVRDKLSDIHQSVIDDLQPQTFEIEIQHKNGKTVLLECTSVPMIIHDEVAGIIGYGRDVTKIRETEERLRRTEKLSIVGELSASVAHEIRNPLTSLKGFVQLLQTEDQKHEQYYKIMTDELNRINHIVGELLLLAKPQQIKFRKANIYHLLSDVISLLSTEASMHNIEIQFICSENELEMECEPNQLKQLFINIIKNAIEASNQGDVVTISLAKETDDMISILVKDEGSGISEERLKRLGEPFYSSKEKGTGLGLTVSFNIVQSHDGKIEFSSDGHSGTEVHMQLPMKTKKRCAVEE